LRNIIMDIKKGMIVLFSCFLSFIFSAECMKNRFEECVNLRFEVEEGTICPKSGFFVCKNVGAISDVKFCKTNPNILIIVTQSGRFLIVDIAEKGFFDGEIKPVCSYKIPRNPVQKILWSSHSDNFTLLFRDSTALLWYPEDRKYVGSLFIPVEEVKNPKFRFENTKKIYDQIKESPHDPRVFAEVACDSSGNKALRVKNKFGILFEKTDLGRINCLSWCPSKKYKNVLVLGGFDGKVTGYDFEEKKQIFCIRYLENRPVRDVVWGRCKNNGHVFVATFFDGTVCVCDISQPKKVIEYFTPHEDFIHCVAMHPFDPNLFATADDKGILCIHDMGRLGKPRRIKMESKIFSMVWYPDSSLEHILVVGLENGKIKFLDTRDFSCEQTLQGHKKAVNCLQFNPGNSKVLVSGSLDKSVKLWSFFDKCYLQDPRVY